MFMCVLRMSEFGTPRTAGAELFTDTSQVACQERVAETYRDQRVWTRTSILNVARIGKFSSDRAIQQYAEEIWNITPVPI